MRKGDREKNSGQLAGGSWQRTRNDRGEEARRRTGAGGGSEEIGRVGDREKGQRAENAKGRAQSARRHWRRDWALCAMRFALCAGGDWSIGREVNSITDDAKVRAA